MFPVFPWKCKIKKIRIVWHKIEEKKNYLKKIVKKLFYFYLKGKLKISEKKNKNLIKY